MKTEVIKVELPAGTVDLVKTESERRGQTVGQYIEYAVNNLLIEEDFK